MRSLEVVDDSDERQHPEHTFGQTDIGQQPQIALLERIGVLEVLVIDNDAQGTGREAALAAAADAGVPVRSSAEGADEPEAVGLRYVVEGLTEQEILAIDREGDVANCSITEYRHAPGAEGTNGQMRLVRYNVTAPMEAQQTPVTTKPDPIMGARG